MKRVALSCLLALSLGLVLGVSLSTGPVAADFDAGLGVETSVHGGGPCGTSFCGPGTFCCNRSCSICAPIGGFCTQQICPPIEIQ